MKKKVVFGVLIVVVLLVVVIGAVFFLFFSGTDYSSDYLGKLERGEIRNPLIDLGISDINDIVKIDDSDIGDEEAVIKFDSDLVYYILVQMGAYNLHNPPFSSDTPKLEFFIGERAFNAEVIKGEIYVKSGSIGERDAVIRTTREEAARMGLDKNYVRESFGSGGSSVELVGDEATLFAKGYLSLYEKFGSDE